MDAAAKRVKAKALLVVADQDHMVSPIPARAFANAMGTLAESAGRGLDGPCGHIAPTCEAAKLSRLRDGLPGELSGCVSSRARGRFAAFSRAASCWPPTRTPTRRTTRAEQARDAPVPCLDRPHARLAIADGLEHEAMLRPQQAADAAAPRDLVRSWSEPADPQRARDRARRRPSPGCGHRAGAARGGPRGTTGANDLGIHAGHDARSARRSNTRCGGASIVRSASATNDIVRTRMHARPCDA